MATRTRKLDIEIGSEAKGSGFKDTDRDLDKLGEKLRDTGKRGGDHLADGVEDGTDKLRDKLSGFGSKIGDLLKVGLLAGGAVAGAALVTGIMGSLETERVTDKLAAQLGGSEWAQEMGEVAGDLYVGGFGDSIADTADAVKEVLRGGLLPEDATNEVIESMTSSVLTFVDVLDQDLSMSVQAVSNMIRTDLAKDGVEALDILTRGIQQGADRAGDLAETFQEYSTMFRDAGISGAEAMGLLVQGLDAGARDADTVADALKEFAIRAQDASEASAEGFEAIGLSAEEMTTMVAAGGPSAREALDLVLDGLRNMEDPVDRNAAAVALFGTKAEDLGDALFNLDLDTAEQRLGAVAGATEGLGSAYDNAASRVETFKREALQKLTEFMGNEVIPRVEEGVAVFKEKWMPAIEDAGRWVKDHILPPLRDVAAWFQEHPGAIQIGLGLIALGFIAWAIAAGAAAVATIAAAWPVLLVIALVALLAAGLIYAYTHWDGFREAVDGAARTLRDDVWPALQKVWDIIVNYVAPAVMKLGRFFWDLQGDIFQVVALVGSVVWRVGDELYKVWRFAMDVTFGTWNWIRDFVGGILGWIGDKISWVRDKLSGLRGVAGSVKDAILGPAGALLGFQHGGVIPGVGPVPVIGHGGEVVFNPAQQANTLMAIANGGWDHAASGGGDTVVYNVNVDARGSLHDPRKLAAAVSDAISSGHAVRDRGRRL